MAAYKGAASVSFAEGVKGRIDTRGGGKRSLGKTQGISRGFGRIRDLTASYWHEDCATKINLCANKFPTLSWVALEA
jgi:hypothetical protein